MEYIINEERQIVLDTPDNFKKIHIRKDVIDLEKWTAALRSGEIKQGCGYLLSSDESMCCLGVLCRVSGIKDEIILRNNSILSYMSWRINSAIGPFGLLPEGCSVECRSSREAYGRQCRHCRLSELNDNFKMTFSEIADVIEMLWTNEEEVVDV